jgi:RNA polymerase, sigma 54 subunit, RpoN/SigL
LTNKINEKGYPIARRTVAKYREMIGAPVARLRKKL